MPPVVVLDACVLYPAAQRDFFMRLAAGGAIRAYWTQEIHEERMRNVERDYGIARSVPEQVRTLMDQAEGDALISHYRHHEPLFTKPMQRIVTLLPLRSRRASAPKRISSRSLPGTSWISIKTSWRRSAYPRMDPPGDRTPCNPNGI